MKKQSKPYIFFDQNVLNKISKNNEKYKVFQNNVLSLIGANSLSVKQMLTPFGLLEFAGLKKPELFDIKHEGKPLSDHSKHSFKEIDSQLIPNLESQIRTKITKKFLIQKLQEKQKKDLPYLNQRGLDYIDKYIKEIDSIYEALINGLILDRLCVINTSKYSDIDKQKFIAGLTQMVMKIICSDQDMGSLRAICRLLQELRKDRGQKQWLKKNPHAVNDIKNMDQICQKLKPQGDLVDCELTHLAFFGSSNKHCHCYTTDAEEDIKKRLDLYCFYMNFFIWLFFDYSKLEGKPPPKIVKQYKQPKWRCGKVFILDKKTGTKITKISATKMYEKTKKYSVL